MRAFVMIRQYALTYKELTDKLKEIEGKFTDVYEAINYLLEKDKLQIAQGQRKRIGFSPENTKTPTDVSTPSTAYYSNRFLSINCGSKFLS